MYFQPILIILAKTFVLKKKNDDSPIISAYMLFI